MEDFVLHDVLVDEKSYENILVNNILCKNLIAATPLRIRFNKIDEFIRVYDGTRYLVLFGSEKYNVIYDRIGHLIRVKYCIAHIISHNYEKIEEHSYDSLPLEKAVNFLNFITLVKSVFDKDKDNYYCNYVF